MNGGTARQQIGSGPKGMGEGGGASGVEQTDKHKTENGKGRKAKRRESKRSDDEEPTIGRSRLDSETKRKLRIGSCNVCGFATEERQRLEMLQ